MPTVLIVKKTTNYELFGRSVEEKTGKGRLSLDIIETFKKSNGIHYKAYEALLSAFTAEGVDYLEVDREGAWPEDDKYSSVVTFGGDGTILSASQRLKTAGKLIGIRSTPYSIGYLCGYDYLDVKKLAKDIATDSVKYNNVSRLCAEVTLTETGSVLHTSPVLNDFLYANTTPGSMTRNILRLGDVEEDQRSSGIWIATASGSTAGIYAAGGEKVSVEETNFQFRVRELYRVENKKPKLRSGFFDPDTDKLIIENRCLDAVLSMDGQRGVIELSYGDRIEFKRAAPVKIAKK